MFPRSKHLLWLATATTMFTSVFSAQRLTAFGEPRFERDIVPILQTACFECHGAGKQKGELDLRSVASILAGGASGAVIDRKNPNASSLLELVASGEMPPGKRKKLTPVEVDLLRGWIAAGLPADEAGEVAEGSGSISEVDRQFWAFRPLRRPVVPEVEEVGLQRTPIDAFVEARLEKLGLSLSRDAESARLLRRLYFDLTGLPPAPETVDAFVAEMAALGGEGEPLASRAVERLVDELLASPTYGERWARFWLDLVGYTDTVSYDGDTNFVPGFKNGRWRYRDYVIDSFNRDKPYDRFLLEQLAGDEVIGWRRAPKYTQEIIDTLAATGFWRNAEDRSGSAKEIDYKWSLLHDTMETFGTSVLGLTLRCARCHSHKHEPIPQGDYYSLLALITPAFNVENWKVPKERALPAVSAVKKAEIDQHNTEIGAQVSKLEEKVKGLREACSARLKEEKLLARVPEDEREQTRKAIALPVQKRTPLQLTLAEKYAAAIQVTPDEIDAALSSEDKESIDKYETQIAEANTRKRAHGWIQAVYDVGPPPETNLLKRGDYKRPGRRVEPGFLGVLSGDGKRQTLTAAAKGDATSSGRRRALARWLTSPGSPAAGLVARVFVNRVWQRLTGVGIVKTSENLGKSGELPTHPQLLEWLADEFVRNGWQLKPLIKQIVLSTVYRQTSRLEEDVIGGTDGRETRVVHALTVDPENTLLWRARLRRLESEAIRDAMLVVAGDFNALMRGSPVPLHYTKDGLASFDEEKLPSPESKWRRSIYLFQRRVYHLTLMGVFDQPSVAGSTCRRRASSVALQSLTMMNDTLALESAEHFASRVERLAADSANDRIELAFRLALGRRPDDEELRWSGELLSLQVVAYSTADVTASKSESEHKALMHLCRVLLNSSEFLYIE
ncbi:MAG: PSD1 and planctomycete cytochrome C domain-containing protein [Planctomycetes bacterium]|nr:PSD1 and planctomycete cytochrome C domain-containing protein [Planctomycetota bacterium]